MQSKYFLLLFQFFCEIFFLNEEGTENEELDYGKIIGQPF